MRNTKRGARDGRKLVRTGALVLVLLLLAFCYMPPGRAMWTELRRARILEKQKKLMGL